MLHSLMHLAHRSPLTDISPTLLLWEAFVAIALLGYGLGVVHLTRKKLQPLGIAMCAGVSLWISIGGWLNLFHLASRPVLIGLLSIGFLVFLSQFALHQGRQRLSSGVRSLIPASPGARIAAAIIVSWFLLCCITHLASFTWNRYDDIQAYIPFAQKASALGGLQPEPFSERRVTSGVGGAIFLNATMLAGDKLQGIDFLEGCFGLLALLLCLRSTTYVFALSQPARLIVFYAAALFTFGRVNITSVNLSAAIFLAVLLLLLDRGGVNDRAWNSVLIGLLLGAAFALKSSNIPFCALLLTLTALSYAVYRRSLQALFPLVLAGGVSIMVFLPWALKHRMDEGTILFPSLGRGYHLSAYGFPLVSQTESHSIALLASANNFLLPALAGVFTFMLLRKLPRLSGVPVLAFFAAAAVSAPLSSLSIAGEDIDRFMLPMENLCALLFLITILAAFRAESRTRWLWAASAFFLLWVAAFLNAAIAEYFYRDPGDIALLAGPEKTLDYLQPYEIYLRPEDFAADTAAVRRAQQSIPVGAAVYETIETAYGFDWRRNHVFIADYPGMASLPPGIPLDSNPEALRHYLLGKNIPYVMFDRGIFCHTDYFAFRRHPQALGSRRAMLMLWNQPQVHGYSYMEYVISNRMRDLLDDIAETQPVVYNDGRIEVVSLNDGKPAAVTQGTSIWATAPPPCP